MSCPADKCRKNGDRSGFALFLVLFAVFILTIVLFGLWTQLSGEIRSTGRIQDDTDHFYIAESVLAKGINKVKKQPWIERYYRDPKDPEAFTSTAEKGTYGGAPYVLHVSDVRREEDRKVLTDLVDFFVKITRDKIVRQYFLRVRLRPASALRPTQVVDRRFARVWEDFETPKGKEDLLARIAEDERCRERNRPASNVYVRASRAMLARGMTEERVEHALQGVHAGLGNVRR